MEPTKDNSHPESPSLTELLVAAQWRHLVQERRRRDALRRATLERLIAPTAALLALAGIITAAAVGRLPMPGPAPIQAPSEVAR